MMKKVFKTFAFGLCRYYGNFNGSGFNARERLSPRKTRDKEDPGRRCVSFQLDDERKVRATAIDDALKKAVVSAYDSLIDQADASLENKRLKESILSAPLNYILDYRVISEGWIRHLVIEPGLPVPPDEALTAFPPSQMNDEGDDAPMKLLRR